MAAHIASSGIPGLDTPNNLYKQLKEKYPAKIRIFSGYIGAKQISGEKYDFVVE
jgi:hypothetical protein